MYIHLLKMNIIKFDCKKFSVVYNFLYENPFGILKWCQECQKLLRCNLVFNK